jgi:hypothetical protein
MGVLTEDQGLQNLSEATIKAEAAEQIRVEARQRLAEHQAATGHGQNFRCLPPPAEPAKSGTK